MALRRHYSHQIKYDPNFVDWMRRRGRSRELEMAAWPIERQGLRVIGAAQ
jgi:hypothetical protein